MERRIFHMKYSMYWFLYAVSQGCRFEVISYEGTRWEESGNLAVLSCFDEMKERELFGLGMNKSITR